MTIRVLHLVGSAVSEFMADLSRLYARDCLESTADPALYEFEIAHVSPDGRWCFPADLSASSIETAPSMGLGDAVQHLLALQPDVVVPQMFCLPGMTSYRALLDVAGFPLVGNPPEAMALAANKARARAVVSSAGVPVPEGELVAPGEVPTIALPVVVKPVDTDNSAGVTLVRDPAELDAALSAAFEHADGVLVERYVELGREVRCGVLEVDGELVCLPLEEYAVDAATKPIRLPADKISRSGDGDLGLVAKEATLAWIVPTDDPVTESVQELARRCHRALGCRDYSLFDFRIDPSGQPWFLEAGLYCSFARQSVIAVMAAAAGTTLPELFASMVQRAVERGGS